MPVLVVWGVLRVSVAVVVFGERVGTSCAVQVLSVLLGAVARIWVNIFSNSLNSSAGLLPGMIETMLLFLAASHFC